MGMTWQRHDKLFVGEILESREREPTHECQLNLTCPTPSLAYISPGLRCNGVFSVSATQSSPTVLEILVGLLDGLTE